MYAERPALPHEPIQQQPRPLGQPIVLGEQLLELVDEQQRARHGLAGIRPAVARQVLHLGGPEQLAAPVHHAVQPLQHAQSELAVRLDGDRPRVGQVVRGVGLELHALLEVDQVELDLVGAVPQRQVGDEHVQQRGLARAGLPGDEHVLRHAAAEREPLESRRAAAAHRHRHVVGRIGRPQPPLVRRDGGERHLHVGRLPGPLAYVPEYVRLHGLRRRGVDGQREPAVDIVVPHQLLALLVQHDRVAAQVHLLDAVGQLLPGVADDERVHAAARPAVDDAQQALGGLLGEAGGEIGDDHEAIRFGQLAGLLVVADDRVELVAEVLLDHVLHVLGQVDEALLDVLGLGPDSRADEGLVVVGEVHEAGEVLAEPDRIEQGEPRPSRRQGRQQPQHHGVQRGDGPLAAVALRADQQRALLREGQHRRQGERGRDVDLVSPQALRFGGDAVDVHGQLAEPRQLEVADGPRAVRAADLRPGNVETLIQPVRLADEVLDTLEALGPAGLQVGPIGVVPRLVLLEQAPAALGRVGEVAIVSPLELLALPAVVLSGLLELLLGPLLALLRVGLELPDGLAQPFIEKSPALGQRRLEGELGGLGLGQSLLPGLLVHLAGRGPHTLQVGVQRLPGPHQGPLELLGGSADLFPGHPPGDRAEQEDGRHGGAQRDRVDRNYLRELVVHNGEVCHADGQHQGQDDGHAQPPSGEPPRRAQRLKPRQVLADLLGRPAVGMGGVAGGDRLPFGGQVRQGIGLPVSLELAVDLLLDRLECAALPGHLLKEIGLFVFEPGLRAFEDAVGQPQGLIELTPELLLVGGRMVPDLLELPGVGRGRLPAVLLDAGLELFELRPLTDLHLVPKTRQAGVQIPLEPLVPL